MKVELIASLPTNRMAVGFGGEGDAKISLDTSADQLVTVMAVLLKMRGKEMKVTFEVDE
jgi:hypothetical protein